METCKECIHYFTCSAGGGLFNEKDESQKMLCNHFKNKTDFQKVKHGYWIKRSTKGVIGDLRCPYECSICGRVEALKEPYCNCGAKMDKE